MLFKTTKQERYILGIIALLLLLGALGAFLL